MPKEKQQLCADAVLALAERVRRRREAPELDEAALEDAARVELGVA